MRERGSRREWVIVGGTFGILLLAASVWLAVDRRPWEWDHANHLERAVRCGKDLAAGDLRVMFERSGFYPPLVLCIAGAAYRLAPSDVVAAQSVVLAFLGIGTAATYLLGRRLAGGMEGVVAASLFATAPFVVFSAVRFQLDLPLASMVAVALTVLLRTEGFGGRAWSMVTGVVFGLGMLTKPPFAVYVIPALVAVAGRIRSGRAALNLGVALVIAGALSLPWYGPRLLGTPAQVAARSFKQAAESGYPSATSFEGLIFYPKFFVTQFGMVAVVLFLAGLVDLIRRRHGFVLTGLLVPFAVFELIQNKNFRYTLPLLPLAAVVAGMGFGTLKGRLRPLVAGVLVTAAVLQVSATLAAIPPPVRLPVVNAPFVLDSPPMRVDWRHREILRLIVLDSGGRASRVSVVPNDNFFSVSNFRYYGLRDDLPLTFTRAWDEAPLAIDYVILKTGDVGPAWTAEKPRRIMARFATDPQFARVFPVIGEFELPDGSTGSVRARRLPAELRVAPPALARAVEQAFHRQVPRFARDVAGLQTRLDYDDAILRGRVRRAEIAVARATVGEFSHAGTAPLRLHHLRIVLEDVLVNPFSAFIDGRLEPLDVGRIRIEQATIATADLQEYLSGLKRFRQMSVSLEEGFAVFHIRQPGPDVRARIRFGASPDRPFGLLAEGARIGSLPVPEALVTWVMRNYDPVPRMTSRWPVPVEIGRVTVRPAGLTISSAP